ncbi:MAG: hypothetical protein RL145_13, partial [Pseudomonadota bacterium]
MSQTYPKLHILSAQLNPIVGDIWGNLAKAKKSLSEALSQGVDILVFTELFLIGYPPEDLVLKPAAVKDCREATEELAALTAGTSLSVLMGTPWHQEDGLFNAVAILRDGRVTDLRFKHELPNYAVFDEKRVFDAGPLPAPVTLAGVSIGIPICEDIWFDRVTKSLKQQGAELLIVPNGSPYRRPVKQERLASARARVSETGLPLIYVNQVGGQDELCFDGGSFALDAGGACVQSLPNFSESLSGAPWEKQSDTWVCTQAEQLDQVEGEAADYAAMVLSLRDYVNKNGFPGVL